VAKDDGITRRGFGALLAGAALTPAERAEAQQRVNFIDKLKGIELVDQYGRDFDISSYRGKAWLGLFSFIHCMAACPRSFISLNNINADTNFELPTVIFALEPDKDRPNEISQRMSGTLKMPSGELYPQRIHYWSEKKNVSFVTLKNPNDKEQLKKYMEFLKITQIGSNYTGADINKHSEQLYVVNGAGDHQSYTYRGANPDLKGKSVGRYHSSEFRGENHKNASSHLKTFLSELNAGRGLQ